GCSGRVAHSVDDPGGHAAALPGAGPEREERDERRRAGEDQVGDERSGRARAKIVSMQERDEREQRARRRHREEERTGAEPVAVPRYPGVREPETAEPDAED